MCACVPTTEQNMMQNVPPNNYRDLGACYAVSKAQDKEMRNMLELSKGKMWSFIWAGGSV